MSQQFFCNGLRLLHHCSPCQHFGVCSQTGSAFRCSCAEGFFGRVCESFDPCSTEPCANARACEPLGNSSFLCECDTNYFGSNCQYYDFCGDPRLRLCLFGGQCQVSEDFKQPLNFLLRAVRTLTVR